MLTADYSQVTEDFSNWFNTGSGFEDYFNNAYILNEYFSGGNSRYTLNLSSASGLEAATLIIDGSYLDKSYGTIDSLLIKATGIGTIDLYNLNLNLNNIYSIFNGSYSEKVIGSPYADIYYGYGGKDQLYGNSGDDILYGGSGSDIIYGGKEMIL